MREFTGMRSPPTACSSISAISGRDWASLPSSSDAEVNGLPPEVNLVNLCCMDAGTAGELYEMYPDVGVVRHALL